MYKLVLFALVTVIIMTVHALQLDREMAVHTLFRAKDAVNRAAHAAALQLDDEKVSWGVQDIDPLKAEQWARQYLQVNLGLDESLHPLTGSWLQEQVEWLVFDVIQADESFPYHYVNSTYGFEATLHKPGVVLMVRIHYPRSYQVLSPISWVVKGVAELTPDSL